MKNIAWPDESISTLMLYATCEKFSNYITVTIMSYYLGKKKKKLILQAFAQQIHRKNKNETNISFCELCCNQLISVCVWKEENGGAEWRYGQHLYIYCTKVQVHDVNCLRTTSTSSCQHNSGLFSSIYTDSILIQSLAKSPE